MRNEVPHELEICFHVQGHSQSYPIFVVQSPPDYDPVVYSEMGCDEDGVFLATEDGQITRIRHEEGIECYEQSEGLPALHLHVLDDMGEHHGEFEIKRLTRESALAYGA
ncbi:hypothetical protein G6L37_04445 [Agrobacterium rubi]|nr:hypothetical protein [Agrobacterium rubi]NTF24602.1 hypothetical protein [Agrobacterium rubi]